MPREPLAPGPDDLSAESLVVSSAFAPRLQFVKELVITSQWKLSGGPIHFLLGS